MNRGLIEKSLRDVVPATAGFAVLLLLAEGVISFVLPQVQTEMLTFILKMPFARAMVSAMLGAPVTGDMGDQLLHAIPWVHPLALIIVFAHAVTLATRVPVAEIDRGTIDVLLGLPVSRWQVYFWHGAVWAAGGIVVLACGLLGNRIGAGLAGSEMASTSRLMIAIANGYCLYLAVGGLGALISCASNSRGRAVGLFIALILVSDLLGFMAGFWPPSKHVEFLSLLYYYRPFLVLQTGQWPWAHMASLLAAAGAFWLAGGAILSRRDIRTA